MRNELIAKLSRFSDYKIITGNPISPDTATLEILNLAKNTNADFVLKVSTNSDQKRVTTQLFDGSDGQNFWTKSLTDKDIGGGKDFVDEATGIISAHVAGYDGAIHRKILKRALVEKDEDLTPMELLQLGKSIWEEVTMDKLLKAIEYLERCIELNPEILEAYSVPLP